MVNSVTRSYEYSALCESCKFKFKASQLRLRWDGLMVCEADWEPRHPSDFYRARSDAHKLPWTRPDDGADPGGLWTTPTLTGITTSLATKESSVVAATGNYRVDSSLSKTTGNTIYVQFVNADDTTQLLLTPESKTSSSGGVLTLPTTPGGAGNILIRTSFNEILGTVAVTIASPSVTMPSWTAKRGHLMLSFSYGT